MSQLVKLHYQKGVPPIRPEQSLIGAALTESQFDAVTRRMAPEAWEQAWDALKYQSASYALSMTEYQQAYLRGAGSAIEDASLVLLNGGASIGIWPLTLGGASEPRLTGADAVILAPAFIANTSPGVVKRAASRALAFTRSLNRHLGVDACLCEQETWPASIGDGASEWHQQLLAAGATVTVKHDLYVDLGPSMHGIRANFRKSYKPLINAGLREWTVFVMDKSGLAESIWAEFKQLHREVAGRTTRVDETWAMQFDMIETDQAFFVGLRDRASGRLVGGGFFQYTRDEGLYSVGAYDRSLFHKPLGHVVQQRAIEWMKSRGLRWYRVGRRSYSQDAPSPTEKEIGIATFKQGFASHMFCRYEFRLPINRAHLAQD
jgi:FemAB family protein